MSLLYLISNIKHKWIVFSVFNCMVFSLGIYVIFLNPFLSSLAQRKLEYSFTPDNWMDPLIDREFFYYEQGITREMIEFTWRKLSRKPNFERYKVINLKIYGPNSPIKRLLGAMVQKYKVPDVDFIYYSHDILRESFFKEKWKKKRAPVFTSAKNRNSNRSILFIDWYYDIENLSSGWNALIQEVNRNQVMWEWDKKVEKLFWRGSAVDGCYSCGNWKNLPRGRLVYESQNHTEIDAAFCYSTCEFYLPEALRLASFVHPVDQMKYKYHIDIDGVTCTFLALQWKLLSGCLVFKQSSEDVMWFYPELIPWKHFVPVYTDLRDIKEKISWAKTHDAEARQIAQNGREFALTHLMPEHILLYCYKTICRYAALQKFHPKVTKKEMNNLNK